MGPHRILITGGTGLLGKALLETAPKDCELSATCHRNRPPTEWREIFHIVDVRDREQVERLIMSLHPQVVIHAASMGSVDEAEQNPEQVFEVNVGGTQAVGRACGRVGALCVFISSNAVFDGLQPPYAEEAPLRAVNRYGQIKIAAETWLRESGLPYVIVRPLLIYGWPFPGGRGNVVTRWVDEMEQGRSVTVADDIYSRPLPATNAADGIWAAVARQQTAVYHLAGANRVSLVEFARETARVFGCDERLIIPISRDRMTQFAPRPRDTSFITTKMEQELGVRPIEIREGLVAMQRARTLVG